MSDKILIAYYSWSGNTRNIAEMIHELAGGTIIEISPREPYPDNYNAVVDQAKKEIRKSYRPLLKPAIDDIGLYNSILIGSPNWWSTIAPPVASFLAEHDFAGKNIAPFCTHGGGGQGRIVNAVTGLCPQAAVSDCLVIYGNGSGMDRGILSA